MKFFAWLIFLVSVSSFPELLELVISGKETARPQTGAKQTVTVVNNAFVSRTFENDLVYSKIRAKYKEIPLKKKVIANIHWPEINDTLLSFQTSQDTFRFYRAQDKIIPYYISLGSSKITLDKNLQVGTPAEILKAKFKLKSIPNKLVVQELEGGLVFSFKQNREKTKIAQIIFESELD